MFCKNEKLEIKRLKKELQEQKEKYQKEFKKRTQFKKQFMYGYVARKDRYKKICLVEVKETSANTLFRCLPKVFKKIETNQRYCFVIKEVRLNNLNIIHRIIDITDREA